MSIKPDILIIEDEKHICDFIATTLTAQGYKVTSCYTGTKGLSLAASLCPDLILLDLGLPDIDGIEVLKKLREWIIAPILIISARTQEKEKVIALDLGADDYITKPFGTLELLARIRTALRRNAQGIQKQYHHKDLVIDFERHLVLKRDMDIHLTQVEFKIVTLLAKNSGKVITYDNIISQIWGPYADGNNRILRVNMANIRRKMEDNPADPQYIQTEIGIGYRMAESTSE